LNNFVDRTMSNTVKASQLIHANTALIKPCSNLLSLGPIKFGIGTGFLSFGKFISNIISVSTKKQMVRIDAGRVVALVTNNQTLRDNPVVSYFPNVTMGQYDFVGPVVENPIPGMVDKTLPNPTGFSFLNLRPKSFHRVSMCTQLVVAIFAAKKKGTSFSPVRVDIKSLLANFADNWDRTGALFCVIIHSVRPSFQGVTTPTAVRAARGLFVDCNRLIISNLRLNYNVGLFKY
jgi:hypothetical protein